MDILYVIGRGSGKNNLELRMSLRSICKYGSNIGNVVIVGNPPKWLSDKAISLEVKDKYSYKHQNILFCIERAIEEGLVKGDFLYSSDDHFYVKPVDFDNYPFFTKGDLRRIAQKTDPYYQYHRSLCDTRMVCENHGFQTVNYSQHCNTHMNTDVFKSILHIIHDTYNLPYGVEPTSILLNAWNKLKHLPQTIHRDDCKIQKANSLSELYATIGDRDCFSIGDSIFRNQAIYDLFDAEYTSSSPFENDCKPAGTKSLVPMSIRYPSML